MVVGGGKSPISLAVKLPPSVCIRSNRSEIKKNVDNRGQLLTIWLAVSGGARGGV